MSAVRSRGLFNAVLILATGLLLFASAVNARAQDQVPVSSDVSSASMPKLDLDYFKGYALDSGYLATAPARFDNRDWVVAAGVAAAIGAGFALDGEIKSLAQSNRSHQGDHLWDAATDLGDYRYVLPGLGLLYGLAYYTEDVKLARTSLYAVESVVLATAFTTGLKLMTHRERPTYGEQAHDVWHGPSLGTDNMSMPSGHATIAFATAASVVEGYGSESSYVAPIAYGLATLCAASRVALNEHWASDVLIGSAAGYFTAKAVFAAHKAAASGDKKTSWMLLPMLGQDSAGAAALVTF